MAKVSDTQRKPRWLYLVAGLVAVWMAAPPLIVVPMSLTDSRSLRFPPNGLSLRWYREFVTDPKWFSALQASLSLAVQVMILSVVIGTAAAYGLTRGRFRGKSLVEAFALAPLIVPIVVFGISTYSLFLKWDLVGAPIGFIVAHTVLAVPFVVITVSSSLRVLNRDLERAAAVLGANPWRVFRRVTLPAIAPGALAGGLFAFVTSFDEIVVSLFISSPQLRTLPVEMYASVTREIDPTIAAASTVIITLSTAVILFATKFMYVAQNRGR